MKPWMMWEKLYQSASCCELSALNGSFTQRRIRPLADRKGWPKACSTAICVATSAAQIPQYQTGTRLLATTAHPADNARHGCRRNLDRLDWLGGGESRCAENGSL